MKDQRNFDERVFIIGAGGLNTTDSYLALKNSTIRTCDLRHLSQCYGIYKLVATALLRRPFWCSIHYNT